MNNSEIAQLLDEIAELLEIRGENPFRIRAYRNAARTVENLSDSITQIASSDPKSLSKLPGIGKDLAEKLTIIASTGTHPLLEELRQKIPHGVVEILRIPGIGPKKAAALHEQLGISSLDELRQAAESGRIAELEGFGPKTQSAILEGLQIAQQVGQRTLLCAALAQATEIADDLRLLPSVEQVEIAGSVRRRKETCGDLDLLATSTDHSAIMDSLAKHRLVDAVLARGDTKQRVRLKSGLELDLRVVPEESYGAALQYFTGSKEHNIVIRRRAQQHGLKVNEYGVFRDDKLVAGRTEEEVYKAVGLPWIPPEIRENRGEIELAESHHLPHLVETTDIRGDLHMHTTATDGTATIREMAEAALARGLKYIAITDHSKRVSMANGLDAARLRKHWKDIDKVQHEMKGIHILKGIECDILEDATLDLSDDVLAEADWVIAVLHYGLKQPREQIQKRLIHAVRNPHVDIIGHPSGRLISRRPGADIDFPDLLKAAADNGKMMEINANPHRLDLDDIQAAAAAELGIPIVISTDAHSPHDLDYMPCGIDQARRARLTKKHVANTRSWTEFHKLLRH